MTYTRSLLTGGMLAAAMMLGASSASAQSAPVHTSVEGQVTKVDAKRGWVDVKTSQGSMKLHFPPSALDAVKKGDRLTVELGLTADGRAANTPKK